MPSNWKKVLINETDEYLCIGSNHFKARILPGFKDQPVGQLIYWVISWMQAKCWVILQNGHGEQHTNTQTADINRESFVICCTLLNEKKSLESLTSSLHFPFSYKSVSQIHFHLFPHRRSCKDADNSGSPCMISLSIHLAFLAHV